MIIKSRISKKLFAKKRNKSLNFFFNIFIIFFISSFLSFILGVYSYKNGDIQKIYFDLINFPKLIGSRMLMSTNNVKTIFIDMDFESINRIEYDSKYLEEYAIYSDDNWVNAKITNDKKKYDVKIRLTGTHNDHRRNPKEYSYRIKVKNDQYLLGMRELALLEPVRRSNLLEWVFMKILQDEGLIYHRTHFVNLVVNGESMGFKLLQEQYDKILIENNQLRDGPIIGFDKDHMFRIFNQNKKISDFPYTIPSTNFFLISPIKVNKKKYYYENPDMLSLLEKSIDMLESFRQGEIEPSKIFNVKSFAKLLAIRTLLSSSEFDWRDIKFYFNPMTMKLEPIGREISSNLSDSNWEINKNPWWTRINNLNLTTPEFSNMILADPIIYEQYLKELNYFSNKDFLEKFYEKHGGELKNLEKNLNIINGYKFPYKNLNMSSALIANTVHNNSIFAFLSQDNFDEIKNGNDKITMILNYANNIPLKIGCIYHMNEKVFCPTGYTEIIGNSNKPLQTQKIIMKLENINSNILSSILDFENLSLSYTVLGQSFTSFVEIDRWLYKDFNKINGNDLIFKSSNMKQLNWIIIDHENKKIEVKEGNWKVEKNIIFPKGYKVLIKPNTKIELLNSSIIFNGPVNFKGTKKNPILIYSPSKKESSGSGILILSANQKSTLENVIFKNFSKPKHEGLNLTGSITFYESDIDIINCIFSKNYNADDYLNIMRSKFSIKDSYFFSTFSDALDSDFSNSVLNNIQFSVIGNDALDFSGSYSEINDIQINSSKDKAVSAGERSRIIINNINIENSNIGVASKDDSVVNIKNFFTKNVNYLGASYIKKNYFGPALINFLNLSDKDNRKNNFIIDNDSKINIKINKDLNKSFTYSNLNLKIIDTLRK